MNWEVFGPIAVAALAGGGVWATVNKILDRRKDRASAGKTDAEAEHIEAEIQVNLVGAAGDLVSLLRDEVNRLSNSHTVLESKYVELRNQANIQAEQISELKRENDSLRDRCEHLEKENDQLRDKLKERRSR